MPKSLNGSAGTGEKIMSNLSDFHFFYISSDDNFHTFSWHFGNQSGNAVIQVKNGNNDQGSTLNCKKNKGSFLRPFGAYNDRSLYAVFKMMLDPKNIPHN